MGFYPGDPNDWSKEDDDHLHNYDPKDRKVSHHSLFFPVGKALVFPQGILKPVRRLIERTC
jgi:hypothetical protein